MFYAFLPLDSLAKTVTGVALSPDSSGALRVQSSKCRESFITHQEHIHLNIHDSG